MSILTLFLSLIIVSFLTVLTFTNAGVSNSIRKLSHDIANRYAAAVIAKFGSLAHAAERTVELGAAVYKNIGEVSLDNKLLMSLMLNMVKLNPSFTSIYFGMEDGSFIGVTDLSKSSVKTYVSVPSEQLPRNVAYAVRVVKVLGGAVSDTWYYLNDKQEQISSESLPQGSFNIRTRPWYLAAEKNKGLCWTDFYHYPTGENGISVAAPIYNAQGGLSAVVATDLTLVLLSNFLSEQTIGKSGKAFVVNDLGEVVFPKIEDSKNSRITESLATRVFKHYLDEHRKNDFIFLDKGTKFVTHVSQMPDILGKKEWTIVIIAPLNDFFFEIVKMWKGVLGIIVAILIISAIIVVYFSKRISSPIVVLSREIDKIRHLQLERETRVSSNVKEIILMDASVEAMRHAIRSFSRYVPKDIVRELFQKGKDIVLGGEKKEITIFFSDIANFTSIAESQPIDLLIPLLTEYFDFISKTILESGGTIDKYMGDGVMAFWGAPLDISDHASRACITALQCKRNVDLLNKKRKAEGKPEFRTRFGINSGTVIVGNIGTEERMNYTVIGDAVNTTFRLQEIDKIYHTSVIISEDVFTKLGGMFAVRPLDIVAVKGKTEKTKIYELVGLVEGSGDLEAKPDEIALCLDFTKAYEAFQNADYAMAKSLFSAIAQKHPEDFPTAIYLQRVEEILTSGKK